MKIASALVQNAYPKAFDKTPIKSAPTEKKTPFPEKKTEAKNGFDTVDLKSGMAVEEIQNLLTTEIGKKVENMMSEAGIDLTQAAGLDWSPEATSGRIFDMTTGLYEIWKEQHPEMSEEELVDSFEKVIRTSVDKGYEEASALIAAAGFDEQTKEVSEKTMSMLHERYDAFFEELKSNLNSDGEGDSEKNDTEAVEESPAK